MNCTFKNIGISGVAGSGKNTLAEIIIKFLERMDIPCQELSIANNLKKELSTASKKLYGIDSCSCSREEKDIIRPFLVAHGEIKRRLSEGKHWTNLLSRDLDSEKVNIITDVRYSEYEDDEIDWLKNDANGVLIHLSRYVSNYNERTYIKAMNPSEKRNDPIMRDKADFALSWNTYKDSSQRVASTEKLLKWIKHLYV
jgi:ABC-type dipeptide/oligopeptide/nickel transport system ATPase component